MATSTGQTSPAKPRARAGQGSPATGSAPPASPPAPVSDPASARVEPAPTTDRQPGETVTPRRRRLGTGELISTGAALILLVLMFATNWYGVAGVPDPSAARPAISSAIDAWVALPLVRWLMLATILVAVGTVLLHLSQRSHGSQTDTSRLVTGLGALTTLALAYRVLIALPSADRVIDQKLGALLGLGCAVAITLGGRQSMLEAKTPAAVIGPRPRRRRAATREEERAATRQEERAAAQPAAQAAAQHGERAPAQPAAKAAAQHGERAAAQPGAQ
jgi:hypothetical protein